MKNRLTAENCCRDCNKPLGEQLKTSLNSILCDCCQPTFIARYRKPTKHEIILYNALKERKIPSILYCNDGFKTIDIVIPEAKVHIEIDGKDHWKKSGQALTDLKRTYHSIKKGYVTLRIPNSLIDDHIDEAIKYVEGFLAARRNSLARENKLRRLTFLQNRKTG